jgi:hypothetical protein
MLTKFSGFFHLPLILIPLAILLKSAKKLVLSLLVAFITISPYLIFNYLEFGNPLHFLYSGFLAIKRAEPIGLGYMGWLILDCLGILLPLSVCSVFGWSRVKAFLGCWLVGSLLFFAWLINQGVDKPPDLPWLPERFLLPLLPPAMVLAADSLSRLSRKGIAIFIALLVALGLPLYGRILVPAIELEDGLRYVAKRMGNYIDENLDANATIHCIFNCPPIAYYGKRTTKVVRTKDLGGLPNSAYLVVFDETPLMLEELGFVKVVTFASGSHVSRLFRRYPTL